MKLKDLREITAHLRKFCGDLDGLMYYESGKLNIGGKLINIKIEKWDSEAEE